MRKGQISTPSLFSSLLVSFVLRALRHSRSGPSSWFFTLFFPPSARLTSTLSILSFVFPHFLTRNGCVLRRAERSSGLVGLLDVALSRGPVPVSRGLYDATHRVRLSDTRKGSESERGVRRDRRERRGEEGGGVRNEERGGGVRGGGCGGREESVGDG